MQKTKIEWCTQTFNPVIGCKHGCEYCYAKKMNDRFNFIPKWEKPEFNLSELHCRFPKKPSKIFVGSMCDLFGRWIPRNWITQVLDRIKEFPQHEYYFLTKNPERYLDFDFSENCWLGTSITGDRDYYRIFPLIEKDNKRFVSVEPITHALSFHTFNGIDLIIIGAMTGNGRKNIIPKKEWFDTIQNENIFYKNNIIKYFPELRNNEVFNQKP